MAYSLNGIFNGFFINNTACAEFNLHTKAFVNYTFKHFKLNFTHKLNMNFRKSAVPNHIKLWVFILYNLKFCKGSVWVCSVQKVDTISENRLKHWQIGIRLSTEPVTGFCKSNTCYCADSTCRRLVNRSEFLSRIHSDSVHFFGIDIFVTLKHFTHL